MIEEEKQECTLVMGISDEYGEIMLQQIGETSHNGDL